MSLKTNQLISDFSEALKKNTQGTKPYDTRATVTRVDGDTVWVHIPSGIDETPVKKTINCDKGDVVQIRVSGGNAWIVGNATSPPTDDTTALSAKSEAESANIEAIHARERAEIAQEIAENTNQYFWQTETGTDRGAHITEIPQDEFLADPTNGGGNLLARSNGIAVRSGLSELATFGANGIRIGQTTQAYTEFDYRSLKMRDKEANVFFQVSDLRDEDGTATVQDYFLCDGETGYFSLSLQPLNNEYTVKYENGDTVTGITKGALYFRFPTGSYPESGTVLIAEYLTSDSTAKAFTFGTRNTDYALGGYSFAQGNNVVATGRYSHAEGVRTKAQSNSAHAEGSNSQAVGSASHAEGANTVANGVASHAEGANTYASGENSHAEGYNSQANRDASHAEGYRTQANGSASHAEGTSTVASGENSHAQNSNTVAGYSDQTAIGHYNSNSMSNAFEIGNGTPMDGRSNAFTVDWNGNVNIARGAKYKINGNNLSASDIGAQPVLESGVNIKTINGNSILDSGDLVISGGGGSGLPTVTTADNGKVLRVVNGVWSAVALPSASGVSF